VSSIRRD